jgi:hypothetical protein
MAIVGFAGSNDALIHWLNQCSGILWQKHSLIVPSFDFRTSAEGWAEHDPTITKPFLQVSWNADGILLMAQTHFQTRRQKYCMSSKHRNCFL